MSPPVLARIFLLAVAGENEAEFVCGDLHEEFLLQCASHGRGAGGRWYWRQAVWSAPRLLSLRIQSGELVHALLTALVCVALPLLALDRLWSLVYSQIPLKDGLDRAPAFLVANLLCLCFGAAIGGSTARSVQNAMAIAVAAIGAAAFAMWTATGSISMAYAMAVLLAAPGSSSLASSLVVFKRRASR